MGVGPYFWCEALVALRRSLEDLARGDEVLASTPAAAPQPSALEGRLSWLVTLRVLFLTVLFGLTGSFYLHNGVRAEHLLEPGFARDARRELRHCRRLLVCAATRNAPRTAGPRRDRHRAGHLDCAHLCDRRRRERRHGAIRAHLPRWCDLDRTARAYRGGVGGGCVFIRSSAPASFPESSPLPDQPTNSYVVDLVEVTYPFFINLLVLMVVTLLAQYLSERLRLTGGRLQEATERAEQAEHLAALGRIAAGLAHEIRNPLGLDRGFCAAHRHR